MLIRCCIDRLSWHLFRGKEFLPGLLAENRDGNGSLPRSRNLISEKVFTRPSTLYGRERADIHHGPESVTPLKAEYIGADQLPFFVFRLQLCGGPYIPIRRLHRTWEYNQLNLGPSVRISRRRVERIMGTYFSDAGSRHKHILKAIFAMALTGAVCAPLWSAHSQTPDWQVVAGGKMVFEGASVRQNTMASSPNEVGSNFPLGPGDVYIPNGG